MRLFHFLHITDPQSNFIFFFFFNPCLIFNIYPRFIRVYHRENKKKKFFWVVENKVTIGLKQRSARSCTGKCGQGTTLSILFVVDKERGKFIYFMSNQITSSHLHFPSATSWNRLLTFIFILFSSSKCVRNKPWLSL